MLCSCAAQLKFWFQTDLGRENSASCNRQGRQLLLTFLTLVKRWSRSTFNFYALIGQNLTGEFMRKIYAASWNWFLWQLKLTEFCVNLWCFTRNEIQLVSRVFWYSWLVCFLGFWLRNTSPCQSRKSDLGLHRSRFSPCLRHERVKVWGDTGLIW